MHAPDAGGPSHSMADPDRLERLRRRVHQDPASIAFAALAETYRRAGQHEDAILTCRAGLRRHPAYAAARLTLGLALLAVGRNEEARVEFDHVLRLAPGTPEGRSARAAIEACAARGWGRPLEPAAPLTSPATPADLRALPVLEAFLHAIQRARAAFRRAVPRDPADSRAPAARP